MTAAGRPRLLVLNKYYAPRLEATAHLLAELCEGLADDWDVTVVTGGAPGEPWGRVRLNGVDVVRLPGTALGKDRLARRALDYASFVALTIPVGATRPRPDVVLSMTDPPFVAAAALGVARRFGAPLVVVCQDLFPETAVATGALPADGVATRVLRALVEPPLRAASRVVALGETMRRRLEAKGVSPDRIRVIPNWTDTRRIQPRPQDNEWSRAHGLAGRFVVMHAGNLGWAQDLETLVRGAALLDGAADDVVVAVVGSGSRSEALRALAAAVAPARVRFFAHQPHSRMPDVLAAASVHAVGLASGLAGYVVPSRLYGVLAAGRPVLAHAEDGSETARLVREAGCGVVVPPGEPGRLAEAIRHARAGGVDLEALGRRARIYAEANADRRVALERYREVLAEARARAR